MNIVLKVYKEVGTGGERERALSTPCVSHTTHNCALPQKALSAVKCQTWVCCEQVPSLEHP